MNLVINAANVHVGGGSELLSALLENLKEDFQGRLIFDERLHVPVNLPGPLSLCRIKPTVWSRLKNEWDLRRSTGPEDAVLCFGNLPPLFRLRGKVLLFLQNRYLVEPRTLRGFPYFQMFRIMLERLWFSWGKRNVSHFIVQTPSMRRAVEQSLHKPSTVLPFSKDPTRYTRIMDDCRGRTKSSHGFLYVASGEPHKNHRNLIEAWILLAGEGIRPGLCLTVDRERFSGLCGWIENKVKEIGLDVMNVGSLSAQDLDGIYREALALIYPSDFESLGLPLIEARCAGLPVLAAERDYVRDVVDPEETFDPGSPVSIARAVKRFLEIPEEPLPLMHAREWLSKVCEIARQ